MGGFFVIIYEYFRRHRLAGWLALVIFSALITWAASGIRFTEDIYRIIPSDERMAHYNRAMQNSRLNDELVMFITSTDSTRAASPDSLIAFASALEDALLESFFPHYLKEARVKLDQESYSGIEKMFRDHLPLFLSESDYRSFDSLMLPENVRNTLQKDYRALLSPAGFAMKDRILTDPLGFMGHALQKLQDFGLDENYRVIDGHVFSADLRYLLVFLTPAIPATESRVNSRFLEDLDALIASVSAKHGGAITADYFGSLAVSVGNARQIKRDIILTVGLALVLLAYFIHRFLRKKALSLAIFLPGILGAAISVAVLALIKGEVSAISLGFGAVLLGITVDFALHFINHLKRTGDVTAVIRDIANPVLISSLSTAGAFFSLLLVRSEAINDLGIFAGISIFSAALISLLILPHLPFRWTSDTHRNNHFITGLIDRIASWKPEKTRWIVWTSLILTVVFLFTAGRLEFERDMNRLSYVSPKLQQAEATLDRINNFTLRSIFLISTGNNLEEALHSAAGIQPVLDSLKSDGTVKKVFSPRGLIMTSIEQKEKIDHWNRYWSPGKIDSLEKSILNEGVALGFKKSAFDPFFSLIRMKYTAIPADSLAESLAPLTASFIHSGHGQSSVTTVLKVRQADKPAVYERIYHRDDTLIFDKQFLTDKLVEILRQDFSGLVVLSLVIVFLILLVSFGRIELAVLTFIPIFLGWIWTLGIMGLIGIKLTIFNIIITSFVFGMGDDYGIFLMEGMLQEYKYGKEKLKSYKISILLSAITTIVGTGVLIFAKHPALRSIAISAVVGISAVWFITGLMKPLMFSWILYHKGLKRPVPVTFRDLIFSVHSLVTYISGAVTLTPLAMVAKSLPGWAGRQTELLLHRLIQAGAWLTVYQIFYVRKTIQNPNGEDFKKPAIIICNHQSHIDLMLTLMHHPKLLVLTNQRVQRHNIFGRLVRLADFFPSENLEANLPQIRKKISDGYSVIVFPEGTRSENLTVQRFHKGAFYLAEALDLDILPIIMHGSGHAMRKGELFLKSSSITIRFLSRVSPGDKSFGTTQLEKARQFRAMYVRIYREMQEAYETPSYFRDQLSKNYVYKGPILEWYVKVKMRLENNYEGFIRHLPKEGHITDIGCGYGYLSHLVSLTSPGRTVTAIDYDEEKISVAENCALKNDRIRFIAGDALKTDLPQSHAFILGDVLHYMPEQDQGSLLRRCIDQLEPGGILLIREADTGMSGRHRNTRLSEFFSTRSGFNKTTSKEKRLYFTSLDKISSILQGFGLSVEVAEKSERTSNVLILGRKER